MNLADRIIAEVLRGTRFTEADILVSRKGRNRETHREVLALSKLIARRLHAEGWSTEEIGHRLEKHTSTIGLWLARTNADVERELLVEVANSGVENDCRKYVTVQIGADTWKALARYRK